MSSIPHDSAPTLFEGRYCKKCHRWTPLDSMHYSQRGHLSSYCAKCGPPSHQHIRNEANRIKAATTKAGFLVCQICGWTGPFTAIKKISRIRTGTRWKGSFVQCHHIIPVARGGSNKASNLIYLCPNHHDIADRLASYMDHYQGLTKKTLVEALTLLDNPSDSAYMRLNEILGFLLEELPEVRRRGRKPKLKPALLPIHPILTVETIETQSDAGRILGGSRSPAKSEAAIRRYDRDGRRACTCGRGEGERHAVKCPVRKREDDRVRRERERGERG